MVARGQTSKSVKLHFIHDVGGPVFVAGTFNGWDTQATPMKHRRGGKWEVTLKLPPGEHQFRYFADGQWFTDHAADGVVPNGMGDLNSIVRVAEPKLRTQSTSAKKAARGKTLLGVGSR